MRLLLSIALLATSALGQRTKVNSKDGLTYVWIAPGSFSMGCSPSDSECFDWEKPARPVRIDQGFWIGSTEVTQAAYQRVIHANPSRYRGPDLPVDQVSWLDAMHYCATARMRLPTGAEWEYAARGGVAKARYADLDSSAWWDGNSDDMTHPVARKQPNAYGLFDMLGNLWEWVQDDYLISGKKLKLLRGGSFFNPARDMRVSNRLWADPKTAHRDMGFRCAGD